MIWASNRLKLWKQHRAGQRQKATERIAHTLYQRRVRLNRPGDQQGDWVTAEKIAKSSVRRALFASRQPTAQALKFIAWDTPRWFLFSLPHLEWVKLLAVPLVIAAAGSIITGQIQREANQNAVLKAYFDKLEELTFEQNLLAEKPNEGAIVLARGRTVAALRELDLSRREQLIAFLQASNLSSKSGERTEPIISFEEQNLSALDLSGMALDGVDFQSANLSGAILNRAELNDANLNGADLSFADLSFANLNGAELSRAELNGANLNGAELNGAELSRAELNGANLNGASLAQADLSDASLNRAELNFASLAQADLSKASLSGAVLNHVFLNDADLRGAFLFMAKLSFANLNGADLRGSDLSFASLNRANLNGADLNFADLSFANLRGADLSGAKNWTEEQLDQARLCETNLPEESKLNSNRDCPE